MNDLGKAGQVQIIVFSLDQLHYALYVSTVERVIHAVEIRTLPEAPALILGVINVKGQIVPVVDIRKRLRLPSREVVPDDQFILTHTSRRLVALVADSVVGINTLTDRDLVSSELVLPGMEFIHGLAKLNNDLVLIYDLDQFLSLKEEQELQGALAEAAARTEAHKSPRKNRKIHK